MNIFYLDRDPILAAQYQCDAHVVKMMTESAQMLATALSAIGYYTPLKPTHHNHPCNVWVRTSPANFNWLATHALALCDEWRNRYQHNKSYKHEHFLQKCASLNYSADSELTPPAMAMPLSCVVYHPSNLFEQRVLSYRNYYKLKQQTMPKFTYRNRSLPEWLNV